jgi:hypothetical protein
VNEAKKQECEVVQRRGIERRSCACCDREGVQNLSEMSRVKSVMAYDTSREELRGGFSYSIACLGD